MGHHKYRSSFKKSISLLFWSKICWHKRMHARTHTHALPCTVYTTFDIYNFLWNFWSVHVRKKWPHLWNNLSLCILYAACIQELGLLKDFISLVEKQGNKNNICFIKNKHPKQKLIISRKSPPMSNYQGSLCCNWFLEKVQIKARKIL